MSWFEGLVMYIQVVAIFITWVSYVIWDLDRDIKKLQRENEITENFNANNPDFNELHRLLNMSGIALDSDLEEL